MSGSIIKLDNGEYAMRVAVLQSPTADGNDGGQATGAGAVNSGVQRMTLASDDPAVSALTTTNTLLQRAASVSRLLSAANSTNATVVKASAGVLYKIEGWNAGAVTYLKIYNKATTPAETDTPVMTIYLPASLRFDINLGPNGLTFATGIGYRLVTDNADNGTTAVAAAAVLGMNIYYT